jgi:hypothetical protein
VADFVAGFVKGFNKMKCYRPVIASETKQSQFVGLRLPRRYAPRNDIYSVFLFLK